MLELALKTLIAYGLGSLMGALLLGRLAGVDIRTLGSGNAGGTNALRTRGLRFAIGVVLIDVSKGWLAAAVVPFWALPGVATDPTVPRDAVVYACAVAATLGHVYPVWWDFRGGKGAATLIGVLLGAAPFAVPGVIGVWLCTVLLGGYVGLSTMCAVAALPAIFWVGAVRAPIALVFAVAMAAFVVYTHRANIQRMWAGTEPRAQRLWMWTYIGPRRS
jgi:acyl phosphate:glycerol-3-phosphate acyltransferase